MNYAENSLLGIMIINAFDVFIRVYSVSVCTGWVGMFVISQSSWNSIQLTVSRRSLKLAQLSILLYSTLFKVVALQNCNVNLK